MPIYEYACRNCGYHFERIQKFSDAPVTECPQCHQEVRRLMSPPAILFNAPGFYVTDNKKDGSAEKEGKKETPVGATCKMCA